MENSNTSRDSLSLNDGKTVYDFDDAAEYQGKTFISFHKQTKFKDQVKHQNLTARNEDREAVFEWLRDCIDGVERTEAPF